MKVVCIALTVRNEDRGEIVGVAQSMVEDGQALFLGRGLCVRVQCAKRDSHGDLNVGAPRDRASKNRLPRGTGKVADAVEIPDGLEDRGYRRGWWRCGVPDRCA